MYTPIHKGKSKHSDHVCNPWTKTNHLPLFHFCFLLGRYDKISRWGKQTSMELDEPLTKLSHETIEFAYLCSIRISEHT